VWQTRRGITLESKRIDTLVVEWETTSIDFKRQFSIKTKDEKAEFIKDMLGLANTQASGRRLFIIGFDDKSRQYHSPPDPNLKQDHLERLLADYTEPTVEIRYDVLDYRAGPVGQIEVLRRPEKLPYRVREAIVGEKNRARIRKDQVFVRHGSQVEEATESELQAIIEEGERARALL
jgi:hypothetical protein